MGSRKKGLRANSLGRLILRKVGRAISDYRMIEEGDRVAVAISGGKDSLVLLEVLQERRRFVPVRHELIAIYVDMGLPWADWSRLEALLKERGYPYEVVEPESREEAGKHCFWCSWYRRKALFRAADRLGCQKLALGHHLDDLVETFLLNLFLHGEISTMAPKQEMFGGRLWLIRPLTYVEGSEVEALARRLNLPRFPPCPQGDRSQRALMREIIAQVERVCPAVKTNLFRSLQRIRTEYLP